MATIAGGTGPQPKSIRMTEEYGAQTGWVAEYLVDEVAGVTAIAKALNALALFDTAGLVFGSVASGAPNLILISREVTGLDVDKVFVTIKYAAVGDLEGRGVFACHTSMSGFNTSIDLNGMPILSVYNYAADFPDPSVAGVRWVQRCDVPCQLPTIEATVSRILPSTDPAYPCSSPLAVMMAWQGYLNDADWASGRAGTWQCMNVSEKLVDAKTPYRWLFQWTFQHNRLGWQPRVRFYDEFKGGIPWDQIEVNVEPINCGRTTWDWTGWGDVGAKIAYIYPYRHFQDLFDA